MYNYLQVISIFFLDICTFFKILYPDDKDVFSDYSAPGVCSNIVSHHLVAVIDSKLLGGKLSQTPL